ncbi:hypothetical protein Tco_0772449 [Tanacetum coccineum]|uniref:Uncharacterized protein n=1 Tax=Tanacetum coccineum TaxID=301880 RepID=A0ABQ4ZLY7_9ASTR
MNAKKEDMILVSCQCPKESKILENNLINHPHQIKHLLGSAIDIDIPRQYLYSRLVSRAKVIENQVMAISVISVSSDSSKEYVGTSAGRVILFGTIPTTIPNTTPTVTPPTTHVDTTLTPTEIPTVSSIISPSPCIDTVVEDMAATNGYTIDDAIDGLNKLLRSYRAIICRDYIQPVYAKPRVLIKYREAKPANNDSATQNRGDEDHDVQMRVADADCLTIVISSPLTKTVFRKESVSEELVYNKCYVPVMLLQY